MAEHVPVMRAEVVKALAPERGGLFVDCTLGLGGHAAAVLEAGAQRLVGIDRDADALAIARERLERWSGQVELVHADYREIARVLDGRGIGEVDGIVAEGVPAEQVHMIPNSSDLDLFVIGGGRPAQIVENYRKITGFPNMPPVWSFGMWMSRSSYTSAAQVSAVAHRLRTEHYPSDVLHLDVGWFQEDWRCDWQFSPEKYPDAAAFLKQLDEDAFQVSLWQAPYIHPELPLAQIALQNEFVGRETDSPTSHRHWLGYTLDLTRPEAVAWYQSLRDAARREDENLRRLFHALRRYRPCTGVDLVRWGRDAGLGRSR